MHARGDSMGVRSRETEKIVVEKRCYFPELYKMAKVVEDRIEMGKNHFFIEIFICKFKNFLKKFKSWLVLAQKHKILPLGFLISLRIIKDLQ